MLAQDSTSFEWASHSCFDLTVSLCPYENQQTHKLQLLTLLLVDRAVGNWRKDLAFPPEEAPQPGGGQRIFEILGVPLRN